MSRRVNYMCISESYEEMLERSESIRGWNEVRSLKRRLVSKAHNENPYIRYCKNQRFLVKFVSQILIKYRDFKEISLFWNNENL
jgi:hypothetical protein